MVRGIEARVAQLAMVQVLWLPIQSSPGLGNWQQPLSSGTVSRPVEDARSRGQASASGELLPDPACTQAV